MPISLEKLRKFIGDFGFRFQGDEAPKWENPDVVKELPNHLYHYTNVDGLMGILKSQRIRSTNTDYLNDSLELRHGREIAVEVLTRSIETSKRPLTRCLAEKTLDYIKRKGQTSETYISCFCENGDLLSQWRGYGKGLGYSLKVSPIEKNRCLIRSSYGLRIRRVLYDPDDQRTLIGNIIQAYSASLDRISKMFPRDTIMQLARKLGDGSEDLDSEVSAQEYIAALAEVFDLHHRWLTHYLPGAFVGIKHEGFREELEWRIISWQADVSPFIDFRSSNGMLVPFSDLPFLQGSAREGETPALFNLEEIKIGPCPHPDEARRSVKMYLRKLGYEDVGVSNSQTPYRTW